MSRRTVLFCVWLLLASCSSRALFAQQPLTWQQLRAKFEASNPTLRAGQLNVDEARTMEITAFLRPNPDFTISVDQIEPFPTPNTPYRPLSGSLPFFSSSYLHERQHKRELRLESAKNGTAIAISQQEDTERTLLFNLRSAFISTLQAKAVLDLAKENLDYYDKLLSVSQDRLKAGDISQIDMTRLDLQRAQYESDVQTAIVNVRTAKIQLLTLLNDRTPVEQFDVTGSFDYSEILTSLDEFRQMAIASRPDLRAAMQTVEKAKSDHSLAVANGSSDPTISVDTGRQLPVPYFIGFSVTIPLRLFDRNQGEKERTAIDIRRNQRLQDALTAQVFSDVDSSFATLNSSLTLLRPYKQKYLDEAGKVRDTITFSYQRGGASLLDLLSAQQEYRSTRLSYLNLVGSYLTAAGQLNLAVGREVLQ